MIPDIIMHLQTLQALAEAKIHESGATDEQVAYVTDYITKIESEIAYLKELQGSFN